MEIFNEERSNYYKAKKREILRVKEERHVVEGDALFIHFYGMSAFIELFPECKYFSITWHDEILEELQRLKRRDMGQNLAGMSLAFAASKSKKSSRHFRRMIKELTK